MAELLKNIGISTIVIGFINLFFCGKLYGICKYTCYSFSSYLNKEYVLMMGIGGFLSLTIFGVLLMGFSKVILTLEEIRDSQTNLNTEK